LSHQRGYLQIPKKLKQCENGHPRRISTKLEASWVYARIRRFISGFANIAKPLTKLREQKQAFQWTPEVEVAFQTLKRALSAAPILAYPKPGERFNFGIGGVLSQMQDGQKRVIAYYSKTLNKAEKNYCVT
jgi:hypothetical protein